MIWIMTIVHTYFLIENTLTAGVGGQFQNTIPEYLGLFYSYLTLITAIILIQILTQKRKYLHFISQIVFVTLYALLVSYIFKVHQSFEVSVMVETGQKAADKGVWQVISNSMDITPIIALGVIIILLIGLEIYKKRAKYLLETSLLTKGMIVALYIFMCVSPLDTKEEVTHFIRTGVDYFFKPLYTPVPLGENEYPYLKEGFEYTPNLERTEEKPNVFLIMIESFNYWAVNRKGPNGKELTPVFNSLIDQGVYVDRYYGNSMLSIKGYAATLTGLWPELRGFIVEKGRDLNLYGLPQVFKDNGYATYFFHAQLEANFHYTNEVMYQLGFDEFATLHNRIKPEDETFRNQWGYEDHIVYKKLFEYLDKKVESLPKDKPVFVTLATIYTHMGFKVPDEKRVFYKNAQTRKEHFSNCIYMADKDIPVFLNELKKRPRFKNSIIIITGDHSYPLGGHGIRHAEVGFYDESFRIPFLMLWNGVLKPRHIKDVYSQVDIAPTLVDLIPLKIKQHHFVGRSMFAPPIERPIFLVQPYSGTYTSVLKYPYKYIFHHRTRKEYLFNLDKDPEETNNLADKGLLVKENLKKELPKIFLNQQLLEENKVFPAKEK